jgi:hypothetical protein
MLRAQGAIMALEGLRTRIEQYVDEANTQEAMNAESKEG